MCLRTVFKGGTSGLSVVITSGIAPTRRREHGVHGPSPEMMFGASVWREDEEPVLVDTGRSTRVVMPSPAGGLVRPFNCSSLPMCAKILVAEARLPPSLRSLPMSYKKRTRVTSRCNNLHLRESIILQCLFEIFN